MSERAQRRLSRAVAVTATVLAAYYAALGGEYDLFDLRELRRARDETAARVDSLRARTDSLRAWADSLAEVPDVIERVARERYSFIRPGERLFLFVDVRALDGAARERGGGAPEGGGG